MTEAATLIADGRAYASSQLADADAAMASAIAAVNQIGFYNVSYNALPLPATPSTALGLTAPKLTGVTLDLPVEPTTTLVFQDIPAIDAGIAPIFTAVAPTFDTPNKPSQLAEFSASLPAIDLSAAFPAAPSLITPEAPTFTEHAVPVKPTTVMPTFSGTRPADIGNAPTDLAASMDAAYRSAAPQFITMATCYVDAELLKINPQYHAQLAAIEAQLTKYMEGGTGFSAAVEDAIYVRARSKNDAEARRVRDQAFADAAARGFTLPNGALLSASQQARQAGADNNAAGAREIVVMQAELEQKNLQFAVTTSASLRTAAINASLGYLNSVVALNGQAAAYASSMVNALVETYNATVRAYSARLEGYKADAQVFQALIQAALAGVEVYKAEIQALQALTQVDQAKVNVYRARIDVLTAFTGMYKTQVDAAVSKASLEKLKIEVFQAQVQAYGAQVSAKNAEWQGYTAELSGNEAQARVFGTQAQAYGSQVTGYKAGIEAKSIAVQAAATTNDARAKIYTAKMDGYRTIVQAKGEVARTQLENQRQQVIAFQAETAYAVANFGVKMEFYKATADIAIKNGQLSVESMLKSAQLAQDYGQSIARLHQANATVHANLAGAAMAGMNSLAAETATA
ncbi:hypothetical protein [Acidithiobacillus sp.]|uniref:hypothetical protein n=1 Tax=Acidithiobacillus sp. TaxID=1872118 RepID=UPI002586A5FE|nr:hypothetical protein [Acidithiobacillus sp.]MDD5376245.1 hypothetical protein [Acidithiobacillus sp.]